MRNLSELSIQILSECFVCDPEAGELVWRKRPRSHFETDRACNIWNAKYPGKLAMTARDKHGYRKGQIKIVERAQVFKLHRVVYAMAHGVFPDEIDHIDGDATNNSIGNLRAANRSTNCRNMRAHKDRNAGLPKWVCRVGRRFKAQVGGGEGRRKHIGFFDTPEEAYQAALLEARRRHGDFARAD